MFRGKNEGCPNFKIKISKGSVYFKGDPPALLTGLTVLCEKLADFGISEELITYAVTLGIEESKKVSSFLK